MDEESLYYADTIGNVNIHIQGEAGTTTEKYINHLLSGKYKKHKETIERLQKYTKHPIDVNIVLEIDSHLGDVKGSTKAQKYLTKQEDLLETPNNKLDQFDEFCIQLYKKYENQIETYFDTVLNHPDKSEELTETDVQAFKLNLESLDSGIELSR